MAPYEGTRNYAVEEIVREMKGISASAPANVANVLPIPPTPPKYKTIMSLVPRPAVSSFSECCTVQFSLFHFISDKITVILGSNVMPITFQGTLYVEE